MKFLYSFIASLLLFSFLANASLITSAGRDFATTTYDSGIGKWHYEAKYNDISLPTSAVPMIYNGIFTRWSEGASAGNGFVQNASVTFGAETGVSLIVDPGTVGGSHAFPHNTTVNWTSNFTGKINFTGWFQRTSLTANNYNISIWKNGDLNQSYIKTDSVNYTFEARQWSVSTGDYIAIVIASSVIDQDPYVNLTAYVEADLTAPGTPTRTLSLDKSNYTESENANLTIAVSALNLNSNITSNFSVKYANGSVIWFLRTVNDTQTNPVYLSYSMPTGVVSSVSNLNETIIFNVSTNLSLTNGTWINFNNITSSLLHKITLQNCRITYSTSPSALTFTTFDEDSLVYINGTYYQMDVNVSLFGNSFQRNYSFIKNNTIPVGSFMQANMTVCIYPEWQTYSVNGLVVYTNNSMVSRVFVVNTNLSEVRKNVSLYLLSNQTADQVIIFVNDENGLPVENVKVDVQRYFVGNGSYISVAQILSDFEGKGTTYLRVNDLFYRFALSINGTLVTSIPPTVIICQSGTCPPYTITLPLDRAGQSHLIERFGQFSTICSFNNATNYLTCDVLDSSGLTTHANLTVENYGAIAWNQVCSNYCQSNVCTLVCLIPNGNTSMSRYTVYAYDSENEPVIAASGVLDYRVQLISWGTTGLYLGLIIVPTLFLLGRFNPVAAITMALIGLIAGAYTAMLPITVGSLVGLIAVAAIIIWKIKA